MAHGKIFISVDVCIMTTKLALIVDFPNELNVVLNILWHSGTDG